MSKKNIIKYEIKIYEPAYFIYVGRQKIRVSKSVYDAYHQELEKEKYVAKKDRIHKVVSYDALDTLETRGVDGITDPNAIEVEELAIKNIMIEKLTKCLELLTVEELELIQGIFYAQLSERELAAEKGVAQSTIHKKKARILRKLKNLLEN